MLSRRALIHQVGRAGGTAAAYRTMSALGLLAVPAAYAGPPPLPPSDGRRILILGAGIAGMVAALELTRAGWPCTILEARGRAGGRNWTLRAGDTVQETNTSQTVTWDAAPHLYFNPGPARIPHHHQGILGYCRALGVELEVMCNDNRAAFLHDDRAFAGAPQRARQVINDSRGYIAELAAKALDQAALAAPVTQEDKERLRGFVRSFGALDRDLKYRGSPRAGYAEAPGAGTQSGRLSEPLDLRRLLQADFWQYKTQFAEGWEQSATMLQPTGGMGRIGEAFARALGDTITYNAEITELRRAGGGARVTWKNTRTNAVQSLDADHVIVTLPFPVLKQIPADFPAEITQAIGSLDYVPAAKAAFQAETRFWEHQENIYGGISWTTRDSTQLWYPSAGIHQAKGILVTAYIWSDDIGRKFAATPLVDRLKATIEDTEHLHPSATQQLKNGVSVAWKNIPYTGSGWAEWSREGRQIHYKNLLNAEGPYIFAGEHMSHITGWQEGAVLSAHQALQVLAKR